jgi:hypothetical protein
MNVVQRERRLHIEERNTVLGIQADHETMSLSSRLSSRRSAESALSLLSEFWLTMGDSVWLKITELSLKSKLRWPYPKAFSGSNSVSNKNLFWLNVGVGTAFLFFLVVPTGSLMYVCLLSIAKVFICVNESL